MPPHPPRNSSVIGPPKAVWHKKPITVANRMRIIFLLPMHLAVIDPKQSVANVRLPEARFNANASPPANRRPAAMLANRSAQRDEFTPGLHFEKRCAHLGHLLLHIAELLCLCRELFLVARLQLADFRILRRRLLFKL